MKANLTILFTLICGVTALANTNNNQFVFNPQIETYVEIKHFKMDSNLHRGIVLVTNDTEVEKTAEIKVARLYKFRNSRIKRALSFKTKRSKAIMA